MSPSRYLKFFVLVMSFGLTSCMKPTEGVQTASDSVAADTQVTNIATIPEDPDPALWVLKDEDTTIYLFGTVHILKPGMSWFDEAIKESFDKSEELVVEMLEPDPAAMVGIVNELAIDKTGVSLRDKLNAEDRADYEAAMASLEIPAGSFDPLEPWFASVSMSLIPLVKNGYDTNSGAEDALTAAAKSRNMPIIGLETARQQLGYFDNLPEEIQIKFLNFTVDSIDQMADGMENMVAQWALANVEQLGELMNAGLNDETLYKTLLSNRNANWAEWVEKRMEKPGTVFMAVGAGHLAGKDSLQTLLSKKGLKAQRIEY